MKTDMIAQQSEQLWRRLAPAATAQLDDPEAFFTMKAKVASEELVLAQAQLGPMMPGETEQEFWARVNTARYLAMERIRLEILMPYPELIEDEDPEPPPAILATVPPLKMINLAENLWNTCTDLGMGFETPPTQMLKEIAQVWGCTPQAILDQISLRVSWWQETEPHSPQTASEDLKDMADPEDPIIQYLLALSR
jgi:hypothetical protein